MVSCVTQHPIEFQQIDRNTLVWFRFRFYIHIFLAQWTQNALAKWFAKMLHWWWNSKLNWLIYNNLLLVFLGHTQIFMVFIALGGRMKRSWSLTRSCVNYGRIEFNSEIISGNLATPERISDGFITYKVYCFRQTATGEPAHHACVRRSPVWALCIELHPVAVPIRFYWSLLIAVRHWIFAVLVFGWAARKH